MKLFKSIAVRMTALLLFFATISAVILYQAGAYDISFIKRPEVYVTTSETEPSPPQSGSESTGEITSDDITTDDMTSDHVSETLPPYSEEDIKDAVASMISLEAAISEGYSLSYDIFGQGSILAKEGDHGFYEGVFSLRSHSVSKTVLYTLDNGRLSTETQVNTEVLPRVRLYFGHAIVDNGSNFDIYDTEGNVIALDFSGTLEERLSVNGLPVVKSEGRYYEINSELGLVEISEESINKKALAFDYPRYFGACDINLHPFMAEKQILTYVGDVITIAPETTGGAETSSGTETAASLSAQSSSIVEPERPAAGSVIEQDGKYYEVSYQTLYGYMDSNGNVVIEPQFVLAHEFSSEGYAAVIDVSGSLYFINTSGNPAVSLLNKPYCYPTEFNKKKHAQAYYAGLNDTIDDLGMYYYDGGYVMVRYCIKDAKTNTLLYKSVNQLLDKKGNKLQIPGNYALENYSDGVMLISKNGKFGYMNTDLSWVSPAVFDDARPFIQGLAVASNEGKYGMIDTDGNVVLPFYFEYVSNVSGGRVVAYSSELGWQIYTIVRK